MTDCVSCYHKRNGTPPALFPTGRAPFKEEKMKTHLRVFAIVVFILVIGCGTASAYSNMNTQSVIVNVDSGKQPLMRDAKTDRGRA